MEDRIIQRLKELLGPGGVSLAEKDLEAFSRDARLKGPLAEAVLWPGSTREVAGVVRLANEHGFGLTARGGGSGLTGGSLPVPGGAVLALDRMDRILEVDPLDLVARVEPGVLTADLQGAVEEKGLFYPPDPASREICTIGGNLAENAGGIRALKYGTTRDYVLGLTAVLGDGRVVRTGTRTVKGVVGFDLTRLLVGSEGTLGVITEATLKLIPLPPARATLVGVFADLGAAARAVNAVLGRGILPVALEFMDRATLKAVAGLLPFALEPGEGAFLLVEVDGPAQGVREESETVGRILKESKGRVVRARNPQEAEELWAARRGVSEALKGVRGAKKAEDVVVPRSALEALVRGLEKIGRGLGLATAAYGHAGDGNVHANILFDKESEEEAEAAQEAVARLFRLTLDLGGTISGEHGVGTSKAAFLDWELGPGEIGLMKELKTVFDPQGVLNPGKIFGD